MTRSIEPALIIPRQLIKWDPQGDDTVWIRQARQGEQLARSQLWSDVAVETVNGKQRQIYKTQTEFRKALECWLAFSDCNLEMAGTGRLFQKGMGEEAFHKAFAKLPPELAEEWHRLVLEINPHWDPDREEELEKN